MPFRNLTLSIMLGLLLIGCTMTQGQLAGQVERRINGMKGYYAELEAIVYSPEGEQQYSIRQWAKKPSSWRVEVESDAGIQSFFSDGNTVWICHDEMNECYRLEDEGVQGMAPPFFLLSFLEDMLSAKNFVFEGRQKRDGRHHYFVSYGYTGTEENVRLLLHTGHLFPVYAETIRQGTLLSKITCTEFKLNPRMEDMLFSPREQNSVASLSSPCLTKPFSLDDVRDDWPLPLYVPSHLPPGTKLFSASYTAEKGRKQLTLSYEGEHPFVLTQRCRGGELLQLPGMHPVRIGDAEGWYREGSAGGLNTLCWQNETTEFILVGNISLEKMVNISSSLVPE